MISDPLLLLSVGHAQGRYVYVRSPGLKALAAWWPWNGRSIGLARPNVPGAGAASAAALEYTVRAREGVRK